MTDELYPIQREWSEETITNGRDRGWVDRLTRLPNRDALYDALGIENEPDPDYPEEDIPEPIDPDKVMLLDPALSGRIAVGFVDIDDLKRVNDEHHRAGDRYLRRFARTLRQAPLPVGVSSIPVRLGGDEFVVILIGVEDEDQVAEVLAGIQQHMDAQGLRASVGGAHHRPGESGSELLHRADLVMDKNKDERKLAGLDAGKRARYLQLGAFATEHLLDLRAAPTIIRALGRLMGGSDR